MAEMFSDPTVFVQGMNDADLAQLAPVYPAAAAEMKRRAVARSGMMPSPGPTGFERSPETMGRMPRPSPMVQRGGQPSQMAPAPVPAGDQRQQLAEMLRPLAWPIYGPGQPTPEMPQPAAGAMMGMAGSPEIPSARGPVPAPLAPGSAAMTPRGGQFQRPAARPPMPTMAPGGGYMLEPPRVPAAPAPPPSFWNDPDKKANLRDFGLRLMVAGEPAPGSVIGPSLFGAVGRAGLGTVEDVRGRAAAAATRDFERQKHLDTMTIEERKIASTEALRQETIRQRAEAQQLANEIAAMRATTARGELEVTISRAERDALGDIDDDPMMLVDEDARAQAKNNVRQMYDAIRKQNGFKPMHEAQPAPIPRAINRETGQRLILQNGKWVPEP